MLAPICLFTYNRPEETRKTVEALQRNKLASQSELFLFSDGPKRECDWSNVAETRSFLKTVTGFKKVEFIEAHENKGLANSIIDGVSLILEKQGKVIVLEDDLITAPNFLNFMNQALDFYKEQDNIFSISGYSMDLKSLRTYNKDFYLGYRASSWGWATWIDRWYNIDWKVKDFNKFRWNLLQQYRFMRGGSDMPRMLKKQVKGEIDSWAIRWCYHQFLKNQLTVFPASSKVNNMGFNIKATHTFKSRRFLTPLDSGEKTEFNFESKPVIDGKLVHEFRNKFSILNRLYDKIQ